METDSFFCQLLKNLPQTLFELLGLPPERAKSYRFDAVEVKKSLRIDGLYIPRKKNLPLYFLEVQFRREAKFYANLFAKVFCYLEENDPTQEWNAVTLFPSRSAEPTEVGPYDDLLKSKRVHRIYLNEFAMPADPPLGLGILQLVTASESAAPTLVERVLAKAEREVRGSSASAKVVQLVEELLIRRFVDLSREEIRVMFKLHDIRKTRVWKEAVEEGVEKGRDKGRQEGREEGREEGKAIVKREIVRKCLADGMPIKKVAELTDLPVEEVRRMAKAGAN